MSDKPKTAMRMLLNEIDITIAGNPKVYPLTEDQNNLILAIRLFIEKEELLQKEKHQMIEAILNFSNSREEAEKYFEMTYGGQ